MTTEVDDLVTPIVAGADNAIGTAIALGVPVLVLLIGIGIVLRLLGKFGVKRG